MNQTNQFWARSEISSRIISPQYAFKTYKFETSISNEVILELERPVLMFQNCMLLFDIFDLQSHKDWQEIFKIYDNFSLNKKDIIN